MSITLKKTEWNNVAMLITKNTYDLKSKIKVNNAAIFKQLEIFIKIVETESLSDAGLRLNLTPSAVSRSLSNLESQVGVTLLKRTTRNLVLTEAGRYLYDQSINIMFNLDESLNKVAGFHTHPQGQLKVTCSFAFGTSHLIALFSEYNERYPDVNLLVDLNDQLVNLNEVDFDIALRITYSPPESYATRKICPIHWAYCASPEYLEKYGEPKTLHDLENHRCLVYPRISDAWKYRAPDGTIADLNINNVIQANSSLTLLEAALLHQGIVYLPVYVFGNYIKSGKLKPLLLNERINDQEYFLYALYFPSRYSDPKVRSFIDFILDKISPHAPWDDWVLNKI